MMIKKLILISLIMASGVVFSDQYTGYLQNQYLQKMLRQREQTIIMQEKRRHQEEIARQRLDNQLQAERDRSYQNNL